MTNKYRAFTRRQALQASIAGMALAASWRPALAAGEPIVFGTLTPLTGAGGPYGPHMRDAVAAVIAEVNAAGGVLGREIKLVSEDDQTNPDAGVKAAKKLIDVDKVIAVIGTWASSVTTAVAPLCWESKTMLFTVSGADSITKLPHQGFIIRTQPNSQLQIRRATEFMVSQGAQHLAYIGPQTPFAQTSIDLMTALAKDMGKTMTGLIYEADKTSYRSEVDQLLKSKPDFLVLGGYTPDTIVLLRDMYRAGYQGRMLGFAYAVNDKLLAALPKEVTEGIYTFQPSPALNSAAYDRIKTKLNLGEVDPYTAQTYDHANLAILALAKAGAASGIAIHDHVRDISQGGGEAVDNAVDGLKLLKAGKKIDYSGASGPCDFDAIGDILSAKFRFDRIKDGKPGIIQLI